MRRLRRIAPRRLGPDEEATLVEHLGELRHRLVIGLVALVPAFLLAFAFHSTLIEWLKRPLPADKELVTLGVTEPFTTAVKVSLIAAIGIALQMTHQHRAHQAGLARTRDARHAHQLPERDLDRHVLQVVGARADDAQLAARAPARTRSRREVAAQHAAGERPGRRAHRR